MRDAHRNDDHLLPLDPKLRLDATQRVLARARVWLVRPGVLRGVHRRKREALRLRGALEHALRVREGRAVDVGEHGELEVLAEPRERVERVWEDGPGPDALPERSVGFFIRRSAGVLWVRARGELGVHSREELAVAHVGVARLEVTLDLEERVEGGFAGGC